jgi:hypothetical protein
LAVRAEHFLATSGVTADALFVVEATAMQINPAHPSANFVLANTVSAAQRPNEWPNSSMNFCAGAKI